MSTLLPVITENDAGTLPEAEPGLEWKNEMRKKIEASMQEMVELARKDRDVQLQEATTDAARERVEQAYRIAMSDLITMAQEAYLFELTRERKERRAVSGGPVNADVVREQQAIMAAIKRGESERPQVQHNAGVGEGTSHRLSGDRDPQPLAPGKGHQREGPMNSDRSLHSNVDRHSPEHLVPRVPNPGLGRKTSIPGSSEGGNYQLRGKSPPYFSNEMDVIAPNFVGSYPDAAYVSRRQSVSSLSSNRARQEWSPLDSHDNSPRTSRTLAHAAASIDPSVSQARRDSITRGNVSRSGSLRSSGRLPTNPELASNVQKERIERDAVEQQWMPMEKAREMQAEAQRSPRHQSSASSLNLRAGNRLSTSGSVPHSQPMPIPRSPENHDVYGSGVPSGYRPERPEKRSSLTSMPPTSIPLAFQDFLYEPGLEGTGTHRPNGEERRGIPISGSSRMPVSPQGSPESSRYMKSMRNKPSFTYDSRQPQGSPFPEWVHGPGDVPTMHNISASRPIPKSSTVDDRAYRSPSSYDMRNSYSSHSPPVQSVAGANRPLAKQPSFTPNDGARARTSSRPLHRYHTQDIRGDQHETRGAGSMRSPSSNPNFSYHRDQPSPMLGESDEFNEDNEYSDDDYGDDYPPGDFDMWDLPPWLSELDDSTPARTEAQALKEYEDLRRAEEIKMMEEKVKQTKEEVMKKAAEAERMAEEVRIREEETRKKEMEMKQKEEELQRREKELEQRELEARKRREQEAKQKEEERKREEEERRRKEREAKEKENERKLDEELKRRAEAAETSRLQEEARMEGFRKEQDEVRRRTEDRKRQDSMGSSSSASQSAGSPYSSTSPSSPWPIPKRNGSNGSADRNSTSSSSWGSTTGSTRSSSSAWPNPSGYSQTSASSRTSSTPTPTPTPSTKPGAWKSANPSQSGATPSSGTSTTPTDHETQSAKERAWARRQAEFAKEQQEKFLRDQERQQRLHATQESKTMSKEEVEKLFAEHERQWNKVATMDMISWNIIPWPTFKYPNGPEDLTRPAISAYVLSPLYPTDRSKTEKDRVKEQIRRWHPDRFDTRMLPKVREDEREKVKEGAGVVARNLNEVLTSLSNKDVFS